ncbi:MAG: 4a-hydroxytetrahydrobiopterin dehydratase [Actinobacteria bacterium]|nr:4a-hydroxytetrahydrobiopterin dehydratase [Actinomycetota bacterium]
MALLNDEEIRSGLPSDGWEVAGPSPGQEIRRTFEFDSFPIAIAFVNLLADAAEAANHHPDIDIRYNRVLVALSTHSEGGVTEKDLSLAGEADKLAGAAGEQAGG